MVTTTKHDNSSTWPSTSVQDPSQREANVEWVRQYRRDIAPHTSDGVYLNFVGNEGNDRVRAAFGDEKYNRLARVKGEFDPNNVFRGNQNIEPA